jgi:amidase
MSDAALRVGPGLLVAGNPAGRLRGHTMVVKDLFDVAGFTTGAGNPDWLADAAPARATAPAVQRLLEAGVDLAGKAHTDELAFSLAGTNVHYGTPPNPAAPGRIPGGSSSGSASAVAAGLADLGVGTDTGGSIRVPASYCGLFGWRPTHGRVPIDGCVALAPSFDTVGLLTRGGGLLARAAAEVLGTTGAPPPQRLVLATDLLELADAGVAGATRAVAAELVAALAIPLDEVVLAAGAEASWLGAFRARQMYEAWQTHGGWITARAPGLGPGIAARFAEASRAPAEAAHAADLIRDDVRTRLREVLAGGAALVLPAAATVAPPPDLAGAAKAGLRSRTLTLTCVAGLAGAPAVVVPNRPGAAMLPAGACLVGLPGDDEALLAAAALLPR